jgi:hypothetical protein
MGVSQETDRKRTVSRGNAELATTIVLLSTLDRHLNKGLEGCPRHVGRTLGVCFGLPPECLGSLKGLGTWGAWNVGSYTSRNPASVIGWSP